MSKAQKRREKKAQEAREREQRIADAEVEDKDTKRAREYAALETQLTPLGLRSVAIKADGHCLFKAISVQLDDGPAHTVDSLRKLAADELRKKAEMYRPFLLDDKGDVLGADAFAAYCTAIETKAEKWGGECEIQALSSALHRSIKVFQAAAPPHEVGGDGGGGDPIRLSYHQHEWALGAHYNAVLKK